VRRAVFWLLAAATLAAAGGGGASARPVDCFADEVVLFEGGINPPGDGFRVAELPGIVLGPPGDSFPLNGSVSAVSLGRNGRIVLEFTDNLIVDGPGSDFIVFENAFFRTTVPADPNQPFVVFAEPGEVAVSENGVDFFAFPYDPDALALVGQDNTPSSALPLLRGLAGITPTFTGDYTIPDDPDVWDPAGSGGVSGMGGDAFDLADVGLASARFVMITDLGLPTGFAGAAEGFDLDSVVALNSAPVLPASGDSDADGLADHDETHLYGSDPHDDDTDSDGIPDGVEAARCADPASAAAGPSFPLDPDLRVFHDAAGTHARWTFRSSTSTYDLIRGTLGAAGLPSTVACLDENSFNLTSIDHPDAVAPPPGQAFFYLLRPSGASTYGADTAGAVRAFSSGDCAP